MTSPTTSYDNEPRSASVPTQASGADLHCAICLEEVAHTHGAALAELRGFLGLELEQVAAVHEAAFGETYGDSVKQVLGVSGAIPGEYFDGLERLRTRLGLSEEAADKQYAKVARTKVKAFGERAVEQLETKAKAQRKEGDDKGGEVMGASLTSEMLALVEYAQGARLLKTTDGGQVQGAAQGGR